MFEKYSLTLSFQKKILLFIWLGFISSASAVKYLPNVEINLKAGNKRHIGRIGSLIPLYSKGDTIFFNSLFVMKDNKSALEGNLGFGVRKLANNDFILGIYGFGDVRRSINNKNFIYQANVGGELFLNNFEIRLNGYMPISKPVTLSSHRNIDSTYYPSSNLSLKTVSTTEIKESILKGYDIEVGGNLTFVPKLENLAAYGTFYRFFNDQDTMNGVRLRVQYDIFTFLAIGGELNHDNIRKWSNYLDLKISYNFSKKSENNPLTKLERKMVSLPVRDIDEITLPNTSETSKEKSISKGKQTIIIDATEKELQSANTTFSGNNIIYVSDPKFREKFESLTYEKLGSVVYVNKDLVLLNLVNDSTVNDVAFNKIGQIVKNKNIYFRTKNIRDKKLQAEIIKINKKYTTVSAIKRARTQYKLKASQLKQNGILISKMKSAGIGYRQMFIENVPFRVIRAEGVSIRSMLNDGATTLQVRNGGVNCRVMLNAGLSILDLRNGGINTRYMLYDRITSLEMRNGGIDSQIMFNENISLIDIRNGGVSSRIISTDGFTLDEIRNAGINTRLMHNDGFTTLEIRNGGINSRLMVDDGFTPVEIRNGGVRSGHMMIDGLSQEELISGGVSLANILADAMLP